MRAHDILIRDMHTFAESKATQKAEQTAPKWGEIGSRGEDLEVTSDGFIEEDDISIETYRKMRKDPQVKACLLVLKTPILQLDWNMSATTEEGQRIARWCQAVLEEHMDDSMSYYDREILTALDFGRSVTEKVWELKPVSTDPDEENAGLKDSIIPFKLKTYSPANIRIKLNPDTLQLEGAQQKVNGKEIFIPADKLLVYSHEKEFNNYNGESVLRAAYKPWIIKEFLQKFWNIALERYGTPFTSMGVPQGGSLTEAMDLMDLIKTKTGIPLPEGYEIEVHNLANAGMSFKEAIEYQDTQIARAMLIPDLIFSNSDSGAYALSKTHSGIFEKRLNGIAQEIADIKTKYLVKPMCIYNFGELREYPSYKYDDVGDEDIKLLSEVITSMITGKVIAPGEEWIREKLNFPAPDPEAKEYLDKQKEVVMDGMENIKKANDALQGEEGEEGKGKPKQTNEQKPGADSEEEKKKAKDKGVMKNAEINLYTENLRDAVRGLLLEAGTE